MPEIEYNEEDIKTETLKLLNDSNLEELTPKKVRRGLEERLNYKEFTLDADEPKALIKQILDDFILKHQQEQEQGQSDAEAEEDPNSNDDESSKSNTKHKSIKSKKRKLSVGSDDKDNSSGGDDDDDQSEKSQKSKSANSSDQIQTKIKRLKSYVNKCGVRKIWSKELKELNNRQQVKHLQNLLQSLGVEGRPTVEKCNKVAMLRELEGTDVPTESEREPELDSINDSDVPSASDSDKKSLKYSKPLKNGRKVIESDGEDEIDQLKKSKNGRKVVESEDGDEDKDENRDNNEESSSSAMKKAEKSGSDDEGSQHSKHKSKAPKKPKVELSPIQEKIAKLKSYVYKCGVRKMWSKELADLSEKEQVNKLHNMLKELGVEGQPTLEKCLRVAESRELEAEKNSVDVSNIIESDDSEEKNAPRTRSSRNASNSVKVKDIKKEVSELEEIKPQKRNDFFSFLNDSDIDD